MSSTRFDPPVPTLEATTGIGDTTLPDGDGIVEFGGNDLASSTNKRTLRSYISSLTKGVSPTPDVLPGVEEYNGPIDGLHANPFPIAADGETQAQFSDQAGLDDTIARNALPGSPFGGADLSSVVTTGPLGEANDTVTLSGHELLPGVIGSEIRDGAVKTSTAGAKAYITSLGQALSSQNLNSGKLKIDGGEEFEPRNFSHEVGEPGVASSRRVLLGDTFVDTKTSRSYDVPNVERSSVNQLHQVAVSMMKRAIGDDGSDASTAKVETLLGKRKISSRSTRAAAVESFRNLNRTTLAAGQNELPSGEDGEGAGSYTTQSWPALHNPDEPYTGFTSSTAITFVTVLAFIGVVLATAVVGAFLPEIGKGLVPAEVNSGNTGNPRKLKPGKFRYVENAGLLQTLSAGLDIVSNVSGLSISNPIYVVTNKLTGYADCVVAGLASFLGVSYGIDPSIILSPLGLTQVNLNSAVIFGEITARVATIFVDSAARQYYLNIIRELNRDTTALGGELGNVSTQGGLLSGVGNILGAVSSIFDSKLFRFVNTLAQIGDLAYTQAAAIDYRKTDIEVDPNLAYASFDPGAIDKNQKILMRGFGSRRIYGNRIAGRRGVSYSLSDLPSYHLVPSGSTQAYRTLLGKSAVADRIRSAPPGENINGSIHFTPEQVSAIESTLEAEYMPFYFQDLRTNEIISFHAFLDDLSDSYQANYNSVGGYGRIEEIKTYKDTKRSVGFTFHIVATNPSDFDYMWWQINKLTTMVYPQWSKGRKLSTDLSGNDFSFMQPFSQIPTATPLLRVRIGDLIRSNYSRFNLKRLFGYQDSDLKQSKSSPLAKYSLKPGLYPKVSLGNSVDLDQLYEVKEPIDLFFEPTSRVVAGALGGVFENTYLGYIVNIGPKIDLISGNLFIAELNFGRDVIKYEGSNYDSSTDVSTFYDPNNNTIIKSFETTRGMGLAGVVTQLQFTWMDGLWGAGDDGPGKRAPRACKVQVSFEPIHDIAPGLDYEGFNRAPIYPVGTHVNNIVEGGEAEPYGVGTLPRVKENIAVEYDKRVYEELNKQSILQKLF